MSAERSDSVDAVNQVSPERAISRRELLQALTAASGAVVIATLPSQWTTPKVQAGSLPGHAQTSRVPTGSPQAVTSTPASSSTPASTPTATPTPTSTPIRTALIGCYTLNTQGSGIIMPGDTLHTYAQIAPALNGRQIRRTITLNEPGHPRNGVVAVHTGMTDATGMFTPPDFDLTTLAPPLISPGLERFTILWEFVNTSEGTNTCTNRVDIVASAQTR